MSEVAVAFVMFLTLALVGLCGLWINSSYATANVGKSEAVAHGCAHYDAKTGAFIWNQPEPSK